MRTRALESQLLMRVRDTPVMRTKAAFSISVGSAGSERSQRRVGGRRGAGLDWGEAGAVLVRGRSGGIACEEGW